MRLAEFRHRLGRMDFEGNKERWLGLADKEMQASDLLERSLKAMEKSAESSRNRLGAIEHVLSAIDPKNVLKRGYSYVSDEEGRVLAKLSDYDKLNKNDKIQIHFADGSGDAKKA